MSNMEIDVKFLAGTHIREAIISAKEMAINLNLAYVCFNFNGTNVSVGKSADIEAGVKQFEKHKGDLAVIINYR